MTICYSKYKILDFNQEGCESLADEHPVFPISNCKQYCEGVVLKLLEILLIFASKSLWIGGMAASLIPN